MSVLDDNGQIIRKVIDDTFSLDFDTTGLDNIFTEEEPNDWE